MTLPSPTPASGPAEREAPAPDALRGSLPGRLLWMARTRPDRVALREKRLGVWKEITWADYLSAVARVAAALEAAGVRPGDHVSILSDNRTEWVYADLAIQAVGARSVGIYQTNPADDVAFILEHSRSRLVFCEDQEQVDKILEVREATPSVKRVVVLDPRGTRHYDDPRLVSWSAFLEGAEGLGSDEDAAAFLVERLVRLDADAPAMVVYTSGTTGTPKGAQLSHRNVTASADAAVAAMGVSEDELILSYLPLCHVAEKIFTLYLPLTLGAVVHFGESIETVQQDLREVSPTVFLGVPRIWEKMHAGILLRIRDSTRLKRRLFHWAARVGEAAAVRRLRGERRPLDRLSWALADLLVFRPLQERLGLRRCRHPVSGAAPISPELLRFFHGVGIPIREGYGQTECAGVSHVNRPGDTRLGTVGPPLPGVACRIAADGEVLVRGPTVFVGYLHDAEATDEAVDPEGWLHTGDVGTEDEGRRLTITGRKKQIIVTAGGKNLSPEKIENALKTSPFVKEAVAVGDRRRFVSALVQIEYDTVGDWATRRGLPFTSFGDLASKPEVVELIEEELRRANEHLARVESVRAFRLLPRALNQDEGELTATQKVRRGAVLERWGDLVEEMYR